MEQDLRDIFGMNVRLERTKKNLTQMQLAKIVGVRQTNISSIESGATFPAMALAIRIAAVFNVTIDELLKDYQKN